jgi:ATP-dependent helicase HepA
MIESATARAEEHSRALITAAQTRATTALAADLQRLVDLQKINDHIRPAEIVLAQEQLAHTTTAITAARLRLDSLRLIVEGPSAEGV